MARAKPVQPAGPREAALLRAVDDRYPNLMDFVRAVAKKSGKQPSTEKKAYYRIIGGEGGNLVAWRLRLYADVLKVKPEDLLDGWTPDGEEEDGRSRSLPSRLQSLEDEALRAEDLAPLLRVVQLLAAGKRGEAQRALSEAGLAQ